MKGFYKTIINFILTFSFIFFFILRAEEEFSQEIDFAILKLADNKWKNREDAQNYLIEAGKKNPDMVIRKSFEMYLQTDDPELRFRLKDVLRRIAIENYYKPKGFIGITMQPSNIAVELDGQKLLPVIVVEAISKYPAEKAGIKSGDMILQIDDKLCTSDFQSLQISKYISEKKAGEKIRIILLSDEEKKVKELEIAERPSLPGEPEQEELQEEFFREWFKIKIQEFKKEKKTIRNE